MSWNVVDGEGDEDRDGDGDRNGDGDGDSVCEGDGDNGNYVIYVLYNQHLSMLNEFNSLESI